MLDGLVRGCPIMERLYKNTERPKAGRAHHRQDGFDWSYSDQAQYDVITQNSCDWFRTGMAARDSPVSGPAPLPQRQQASTPRPNSQYLSFCPINLCYHRHFAYILCYALLSRSVVRVCLFSLCIDHHRLPTYCIPFFLTFQGL